VGRGIVVDDCLQTGRRIFSRSANAPSIAAICMGWLSQLTSRRGSGAAFAGCAAAYSGRVVATNLKVSGVSVFSRAISSARGKRSHVLNDVRHGTYKKLVIADGRLVARLVGDAGMRCGTRIDPQPRADRPDSQPHDVRRSLALRRRRMTHDRIVHMTAVDPTLRATRTTCPYCGVGCGVLATPDRAALRRSRVIRSSRQFRRLCSKGRRSAKLAWGRLLYPMIRCSKGTMERVAWTDASTMSRIALRISSSAMARTRGVLSLRAMLTEDYYVATS